jgi:hypothetical protein
VLLAEDWWAVRQAHTRRSCAKEHRDNHERHDPNPLGLVSRHRRWQVRPRQSCRATHFDVTVVEFRLRSRCRNLIEWDVVAVTRCRSIGAHG